MARKHPSATYKVVSFLGEYRIQDLTGTLLGSGTSLIERVLDAHKDSLGFVWTDRAAANRALALVKETV